MANGSRVPRVCAYCGADFNVWPSDIVAGGGKHCSRTCAYANRPDSPPSNDPRPTPTLPPHVQPTRLVERAMAKLRVTTDGCWEWIGWRTRDGYGALHVTKRDEHGHRKMRLVHRWLYEQVRAPISAELDVDHLCRNRACCNPDHLEPVPHRTNLMRGVSPSSVNARKTHCVHGHAFTPENTRWKARGSRDCRMCERIRRAARRRAAETAIQQEPA